MGVHIMPKSKLSLASKAKLDEQKHEKKANICRCGALRIGDGPRSQTNKFKCPHCRADTHASHVIREMRLEDPERAMIAERAFTEKRQARQAQGKQYIVDCKASEKTETENIIKKEVNAKVSSWYSQRERLSGCDFRRLKAVFLKDIRDFYKAEGEEYANRKLNEDKRHNALNTKFGI